MRLAMHGVRQITDEQARYFHQLGVKDVNLNQYWASFPGDHLTEEGLLDLKHRAEDHGFSVPVLENIPIAYYDKIFLGLPGRDEQIENLKKTMHAIGRSGIPVFGFNFMPSGVWRTNLPLDAPQQPYDYREASPEFGAQRLPPQVARGGAAVSTFNAELVRDAPPTFGRAYEEEEVWRAFTDFIRTVMPIAEDYGLKVSIHPDDPVIPSIGGVARPFRQLAAFERAVEIADSDLFGVTFCLGNWTLMGLDQMRKGLRLFGEAGRIHYVHFQAVRGTPERFAEMFFDESDIFPEVIRTLNQVAFGGVLVPAHAPVMGRTSGPFEDPWQQDHEGLTHAVGYLQGLLRGILGEPGRPQPVEARHP